ncbi:unnamed protein product [Ilex paraguariensis]|uniref:DUF3475 domain-containing protein n=1 Tax=Ilex paraguariensis TaxID=185542 RepID=A0ABC8QQT4_9AQUA
MVAEPWIRKMGNQVSSNLKHAFVLETSNKAYKKQDQPKETIGILSFEVANVMSKTVHLHKSLTDSEISKLKNEVLKSDDIKTLISRHETHLLELVLAEKLDELNWVAGVVSRLGKKCTIPALQGFEHVYGDIVSGGINVRELGFLVKDMEGMMRKMERYVNSTASLYREIEVLNELEQTTKKFKQKQFEVNRKTFEQKMVWQKQDVRHLKNVSIWNQTYDKVVELLARTVCTIYARFCLVFGDAILSQEFTGGPVSGAQFDFTGNLLYMKQECDKKSGQIDLQCKVQIGAELTKPVLRNDNSYCYSGLIERNMVKKKGIRPQVESQRGEIGLFRPKGFNVACGMGPGRLFMECFSLSTSASKVDDDVVYDDRTSQISGCCSIGSDGNRERPNYSGCFNHSQVGVPLSVEQGQFKVRVTNSAKFCPNTVGGSALAFHYANVILVIEKLLCYPHLVGEEARDDLYHLLPTSFKKTLKANLKSHVKNLVIYDSLLAHEWKERLDEILRWLGPMAHNMIRWQSERNFEQQQIVTQTNVLLLQTLYFADREKMEAAICELLVGLNYICRHEHQQNALLDCASSFDFDDCME